MRTTSGGTPDAPITITGPPDAVFNADGPFEINHSHVHLRGMTFDGLHRPESPEDPNSYSESILQVNESLYEQIKAGRGPTDTVDESEYLTDVVVKPHAVGNCRADFIKVHWSKNVEIGEFEVIGPAGVKYLLGDASGHNGEVVYVGNPPDKGYPVDGSHDIHVHHIDNSEGYPHAELVDVKAGCHDVLIEYCTDAGGAGRYVLDGHDATDEPSMHLGGRECTLRWNVIEGSHGQGVEVAAWGLANPDDFAEHKGLPYPEELRDHGRANSIYGNRITEYGGLAIRYPVVYPDDGPSHVAERYGADDQRVVCGNAIDGPTHGKPDSTCDGDVPTTERIGHLGGDSPWN
ncbi:hypothetical protein [Halorussus litoreus]|uniref:hypothetical protein n=1 Tax=Halorussus litoreus TaxID=1710536 RepID=UPI0013008E48|nr:hypothetical protein [Halorussus litoreus]